MLSFAAQALSCPYWLNRVYSWFCHLAHRFSVRSLAVRPPFCFASCEFDLFSLQIKATLWNGTAHNQNSYWVFFFSFKFLLSNFQVYLLFLRKKKLWSSLFGSCIFIAYTIYVFTLLYMDTYVCVRAFFFSLSFFSSFFSPSFSLVRFILLAKKNVQIVKNLFCMSVSYKRSDFISHWEIHSTRKVVKKNSIYYNPKYAATLATFISFKACIYVKKSNKKTNELNSVKLGNFATPKNCSLNIDVEFITCSH